MILPIIITNYPWANECDDLINYCYSHKNSYQCLEQSWHWTGSFFMKTNTFHTLIKNRNETLKRNSYIPAKDGEFLTPSQKAVNDYTIFSRFRRDFRNKLATSGIVDIDQSEDLRAILFPNKILFVKESSNLPQKENKTTAVLMKCTPQTSAHGILKEHQEDTYMNTILEDVIHHNTLDANKNLDT